eukprot:202863-Pleurochrysis_carterae.AAC.2
MRINVFAQPANEYRTCIAPVYTDPRSVTSLWLGRWTTALLQREVHVPPVELELTAARYCGAGLLGGGKSGEAKATRTALLPIANEDELHRLKASEQKADLLDKQTSFRRSLHV